MGRPKGSKNKPKNNKIEDDSDKQVLPNVLNNTNFDSSFLIPLDEISNHDEMTNEKINLFTDDDQWTNKCISPQLYSFTQKKVSIEWNMLISIHLLKNFLTI